MWNRDYREGVILNDTQVDYRIEGRSSIGWLLFDRTDYENRAKELLKEWRNARGYMKFRLIKVTTTITREILTDV